MGEATEIGAGGDEGLMLCPRCGYDLRGAVGGRCSECGLEVDREALKESGFPWAHRQKIGRVRGYVGTVWQVAVGSRRLAMEAARPQEGGDGRKFRWVTAGVVAVSLLGMWALVVGRKGGLGFLAYRESPMFVGFRVRAAGPPAAPWLADVAVPWSAGATMVWVIPVCLVLLACYVTGVQQVVFRAGGRGEAYARRAGVIAHYAAGPLALMLPGVACQVMGEVLREARVPGPVALLPLVAGLLFGVMAIAGTVLRVGQWAARVRHAGVGAAMAAAGELVELWLVGIGLCLGVLPWCVGYLWIVVDSFL